MSESVVGQIALELGVNTNSLKRQLMGAGKKAEGIAAGAFKKVGLIIAGAFAAKALFDFGKASIGLASDLQEVQNVVDVTFGSMSSQINDFAKDALFSFGLSELSAKKYASTMGAMLKSSGLAGDQMKEMSITLAGLAGDMASFYNLSGDEAFNKIRAGISGETEPLKQLGVNMSVANMEAFALSQGITKSYQAMNQAEQSLLRYNYLLSVTKDAQGDFARTSDSWANQTRLLTEQWKIFQGTMGQGFINMLTPVVKGLNFLIQKLQIAAQYFKAFTELLFGAQKTAGGAKDSTEELAGSLGGAGGVGKEAKKAGKEVKGSLSSFDQLNVIAQSAAGAMEDLASDVGGVGGADLGAAASGDVALDIDLEPFKAKLEEIGRVAQGVGIILNRVFGPPLKKAMESIMSVLERWKETFKLAFTEILKLGEPLKVWFVNDLIPFWQQGIVILGGVIAGIGDSMLLVFQTTFMAILPIIRWFVEDGLSLMTEIATGSLLIFQALFNNVKSIFDRMWKEGVYPAMMLMSNIIVDVLNSIKKSWNEYGKSLIDGTVEALNNIGKIFATAWESIFQPVISVLLENVKWLWDEHFKGLLDSVLKFVNGTIENFLSLWNNALAPFIDWFIGIFGPAWSNIFETIISIVSTCIGVVVDIAKGLIDTLGGIITFLTGVFTGDWEKAWLGIKDIFSGIATMISGLFKGMVNLIIDSVNFLIRGLNKIKISVPDWVSDLMGIKSGAQWGFNIATIPKLAQGGLATGPTLAMVGDNRNAKADPEVISPLSKLQGMIANNNQPVVEAIFMLIDALEKKTFDVELDGESVARKLSPYSERVYNQRGQRMITVGGA